MWENKFIILNGTVDLELISLSFQLPDSFFQPFICIFCLQVVQLFCNSLARDTLRGKGGSIANHAASPAGGVGQMPATFSMATL